MGVIVYLNIPTYIKKYNIDANGVIYTSTYMESARIIL